VSETRDLDIVVGPEPAKLNEMLRDVEDVHGERMTLQMGPQHPATHGVLRLELETDGELVIKARVHIGYLHRCFEKVCENMTWPQIVPYTDRLDYCSAMNNSLGYALACEKLFGIEVSDRVQTIRVLVAEMNRIANHMVAVGTYGLDIGAWTPFLFLFQQREHILDLYDELSGQRLLYNYIWIGGLAHDIPDGWLAKVREYLTYMEGKLTELNTLLSYNKIYVERTANVAVLPPELAFEYGITGPNLRGSGVPWDLRKVEPYSGYEKYDFEIPVGDSTYGGVTGDCFDRYMVRVKEMGESLKIMKQAIERLEKMPADDVRANCPTSFSKMPVGECYVRTESPKGELGYYIVSDGKGKPYRLKCRAPSFTALSVIPRLAPGLLISDIVALVGSLDIVLGEVDR
jgi:NADH-quinone oxidoreductase subunit D